MLPFGSVTSTRESLLPSISLSKHFSLSAHLFYIYHSYILVSYTIITSSSISSIHLQPSLILSSLLSRISVSLSTLNTHLHALCHTASYPSMKWGLLSWLGHEKELVPRYQLMNMFVTLPMFRPDAVAFFRVKMIHIFTLKKVWTFHGPALLHLSAWPPDQHQCIHSI